MAQTCAYTYAVIVWMNFCGFAEFGEFVVDLLWICCWFVVQQTEDVGRAEREHGRGGQNKIDEVRRGEAILWRCRKGRGRCLPWGKCRPVASCRRRRPAGQRPSTSASAWSSVGPCWRWETVRRHVDWRRTTAWSNRASAVDRNARSKSRFWDSVPAEETLLP